MPSAQSCNALHDPASSEYKKAKRQYIKATKHRLVDVELDWTPFRAAEKRYKARFPPPDLSNVLDLAALDAERTHEIQRGIWSGSSDAVEYTDITLGNRKAYSVPRIPGAAPALYTISCHNKTTYSGLVLLPSFISQEQQRQLVQWSLCDQARYPNETNLDIHYLLPQEGIWNTYLRSRSDPSKDALIHPKASKSVLVDQPIPGPRQLINNTPATPDTFTLISSAPKPPQLPSPTAQPALSSALLHKMRWANIGWYYHWGTKQYDFTKGKGTVDITVGDLCKSAVATVDWGQLYSGTDNEWGDAGPEWEAWNETYGALISCLIVHPPLSIHLSRTGCRHC